MAGGPVSNKRRSDVWNSPQFANGQFHNRTPAHLLDSREFVPMLAEFASRQLRRPKPPTVLLGEPEIGDPAALATTWLGHASVLLEVSGQWVLFDPIWSERASPLRSAGPRRTHPMPLALDALPPLTAIVISHDHYDHLDITTVSRLLRTQDAPFVVPLGVGAHLRRWGVPERRIIERDWGGCVRLATLKLVCTEARHFSGRGLTRNRTLWSSWVVHADDGQRVFFGGDTGYTPAFSDLGAEYGPFDLTILPIGSYDRRWPDVHLDPEQAAQTHLDVRGRLWLPIHWLTFDLAFHPMFEPIDRALSVAEARDLEIAVPRPGERIVMGQTLPAVRWW